MTVRTEPPKPFLDEKPVYSSPPWLTVGLTIQMRELLKCDYPRVCRSVVLLPHRIGKVLPGREVTGARIVQQRGVDSRNISYDTPMHGVGHLAHEIGKSETAADALARTLDFVRICCSRISLRIPELVSTHVSHVNAKSRGRQFLGKTFRIMARRDGRKGIQFRQPHHGAVRFMRDKYLDTLSHNSSIFRCSFGSEGRSQPCTRKVCHIYVAMRFLDARRVDECLLPACPTTRCGPDMRLPSATSSGPPENAAASVRILQRPKAA